MVALLRLRAGGRCLLVAPIDTLVQRLPAPDGFAALHLAPGGDAAVDTLAARLDALGYVRDEQVDVPGEAAFRGAVVDIFPADATLPARLRLEDGRIAAIDLYDPLTQRSVQRLDMLAIGPASELVFDGPGDRPPGLEHFLPERVARLVTVFDLLPAAAMLLDPGADERLADRFAQIAEARQTRLALSGEGRPVLPPASLYLTEAEWRAACAGRSVVGLAQRAGEALPNFAGASEPAEACAAFVAAQAQRGRRVGLVGRRLAHAIHDAMDQEPADCAGWPGLLAAPPGTIAVLPGRLESGFATDVAAVVASGDVFGPAADGAGGSAWPVRPCGPATWWLTSTMDWRCCGAWRPWTPIARRPTASPWNSPACGCWFR